MIHREATPEFSSSAEKEFVGNVESIVEPHAVIPSEERSTLTGLYHISPTDLLPSSTIWVSRRYRHEDDAPLEGAQYQMLVFSLDNEEGSHIVVDHTGQAFVDNEPFAEQSHGGLSRLLSFLKTAQLEPDEETAAQLQHNEAQRQTATAGVSDTLFEI